MGDQELIMLIQNGDTGAFRELMERYHQLICYIIWQFKPINLEIEDLVQEVYLRIYTSLSKYREKGSLKSWIGKITRNLCIDQLRSNKSAEPFHCGEVEMIEDSAILPEEAVMCLEVQDQVREALSKLPEHYRVTIILRYYYEFTYQEISETLEIPLGTVMSRLSKARKLLKDNLLQLERGDFCGLL